MAHRTAGLRPRRRRAASAARPRWQEARRVAAGVGLALAAVLCLPFTLVAGLRNGTPLTADYRLAEEDFAHPRLRLLRAGEHLDAVVAGAPSQFATIVRLRAWTHRQWVPARRFYYPSWDAVEILHLARTDRNRGFCAQYAIVLLQACQSLGLHARYVEMPGHCCVSVWSDDFNKWVLMDPYHDVHYEREGRPLGGRALCEAFWTGEEAGILRVGSDGYRAPVSHGEIAAFRTIAIDTRADQLSAPMLAWWHGAARRLVRAADYHAYPLVGRDLFAFWRPQLVWKGPLVKASPPGAMTTARIEDFQYRENQTILTVRPFHGRDRALGIDLAAVNASTCSGFLVRDDHRDWHPVDGSRVTWTLVPGVNRLHGRIRTRDGWLGPESSVTVWRWPGLAGVPGYFFSSR